MLFIEWLKKQIIKIKEKNKTKQKKPAETYLPSFPKIANQVVKIKIKIIKIR